MSDDNQGGDFLQGVSDTLSNVTGALTGGLLPDARGNHEGILAEAVKCLFGHDPWAAESWGGAVKQTPPANRSEPSADRPAYTASPDPVTGIDPAKKALATVVQTDAERARMFNPGPSSGSIPKVTTVAPGMAVSGNPMDGGPAHANAESTPVSGDSIRADAAAQAVHPDGSPPPDPSNNPVAPPTTPEFDAVRSERQKNLEASQKGNTSVYSPTGVTEKPVIWSRRSDIDAAKPAGSLSPKREATVQATGGRPGPLTMSAPAKPPTFWEIYKGSGASASSPARTATGAYEGANTEARIVPNDANFATPERFGEPGENLVRFRTASGANVSVNANVAGNFKGFTDELERAGYKIDPEQTGGFANRTIAGSSRASQHSLGNALDINWDHNTVQSGGKNTLPPNVAQIAAKYGLTWGGTWRKRDTMHFEYHPVHGVPMRGLDQVGGGQPLLAGADLQ
jgi:hypothetical protein